MPSGSQLSLKFYMTNQMKPVLADLNVSKPFVKVTVKWKLECLYLLYVCDVFPRETKHISSV